MHGNFSVSRLAVIAFFLATTGFLLPLALANSSDTGFLQPVSNSSFNSSLARTVVFAVLSAIINVFGGLGLAMLLSRIPANSRWGNALAIFIMPVTLGNTAVVFLCKLLLFNTRIFETIAVSPGKTQAFLLFLQFWQFGFLFAYLFWLAYGQLPRRVVEYSQAIQLTGFERFRDVILPQFKNLSLLLFILSFIFSFYEDAKSQLLFWASEGSRTEFIHHWLNRTYQSRLFINPDYANGSTIKAGVLISLVVIIILAIAAMLLLLLFRIIYRTKSLHQKPATTKPRGKSAVIAATASLAIILAPIAAALLKAKYYFYEELLSILFPLLLTFIACAAATLISVCFAVAARLSFRKWLTGFNERSLGFFIVLLLLQVLPPLCIILSGFKWLSWTGYHNNFYIYLIWIIGHCILTLPLLGSFLVTTHFAVRENELQYLQGYQVSRRNVIRDSFLTRFGGEYFFTFLFAFSFIWNDAGLNMVLSDIVPSFATRLQMLFSGRGSDYSKAAGFALVAIILSVACVMMWQFITRKQSRLKNNENTGFSAS